MNEDFIRSLEYMGLATLLKRISDTMIHSGRQMYKEINMDIEPNWYLIFKLLEKYETLSVTEIAERLCFAHPSVITIVEKMKTKGYLESSVNQDDKRKQQLKLSEKALCNMPKFEELWICGKKGMQGVFENKNLLTELEKLETALTKKSFKDRVFEHYLPIKKIEVVAFNEKYTEAFAKLNYEWLNQYFKVEEHDLELLDNPKDNIINKGGYILMAINENKEAVGTVALLKYDNTTYELAKMAVTPAYKGYKIADKLMEKALTTAKETKAKRIFLETNTFLNVAINLYKKHGFVEVPLDENSPYARSNYKMELLINS